MRLLHAASEIFPLVKTGGLADVLGALPAAQAAAGDDVMVVVPGYPRVLAAGDGLAEIAPIAERFGAAGRLLKGRLAGLAVPAYVVDIPDFFDREGNPYLGPDGTDWPDNWARFAAFARAAADLAAGADPAWRPDLLHAHDWQAALAPAFLAHGSASPSSVLTVHNLAYQGLFPAERYASLGLPAAFWGPEGAEYWGQLSYLKAGLMTAGKLSTVSRTYAAEIQGPEQGCGLDGVLRARSADLTGIVNGVDYAVWSPEHDPYLPCGYRPGAMAGKALVKTVLRRELGLESVSEVPLFGVVSRLTWHKGLDLLAGAAEAVLSRGAQIALLGSGEKGLEAAFQDLAVRHPGQVAVRLGYDEALAHRIIGGADVILVPSRSEPCGLTQLYGLKYGTLPLVRATGGLADTVVNAEAAAVDEGRATGFVFHDATAPALAGTLGWVCDMWRDRAVWQRIQAAAMAQDFSWDRAAAAYRELYSAALASG